MTPGQKQIINTLISNRQINNREDFFNFDYDKQVLSNDPFLLPDMTEAVDRLVKAHEQNQKIVIFGDYDADGITASTVLTKAFKRFGFKNINVYLPDRFSNGYGMTKSAIDEIKLKFNPDLIVTVDCGSLNEEEIKYALTHDIETIVTDHHHVAQVQPPAVGVVNPRRKNHQYPSRTLAGVGVAFSLVRALQTRLNGLSSGQEKWLLDLVAIGTVADLMELTGENRALVYYGLKVLAQSKHQGLKKLLENNQIDLQNLSTDSIGFVIAPRLNAAGRLKSAELAYQVLNDDSASLDQKLTELDFLNEKRRALQNAIITEATDQAKANSKSVLVLRGDNWHEGVVGIVASHIMEDFQKPTFILSQNNDKIKGSARSFGDFSIFDAIENAREVIIKGGGHSAAGGVSLEAVNFAKFDDFVNQYYDSLNLQNQERFLKAQAEISLDNFAELNLDFYQEMMKFAPFGNGNSEPVFAVKNLKIDNLRYLTDGKHLKLTVRDQNSQKMDMIKFNCNQQDLAIGDTINLIFKLTLNSWQGQNKLEGFWLYYEK